MAVPGCRNLASACRGLGDARARRNRAGLPGNRVASRPSAGGSARMAGPLFILCFVILSAFRDVFFSGALRAAPFFAVALVAFATCTAAFLLVALVERKRTLSVVFADRRTFLMMNLFTAWAWLSYFQALRHLEPAIA